MSTSIPYIPLPQTLGNAGQKLPNENRTPETPGLEDDVKDSILKVIDIIMVINILKSKISESLKSVIDEAIKNKAWRKIFNNAGNFLIQNPDTERRFAEDLQAVFSEENLSQIADSLNDVRGFEFTKLLRNKLQILLQKYDISEESAETYIHFFIKYIVGEIQKIDHQKGTEIFYQELKEDEESHFRQILKKLEKLDADLAPIRRSSISTIYDIAKQIRRDSFPQKLDLSFFEINDEVFEKRFSDAINQESIYVIGRSREETLYRILNEINQKYRDRETLIIYKEEDWNVLYKQEVKDYILIPFFNVQRTFVIPDNTNIFIYTIPDPCYSQEKIELRRRTKGNIIASLKKAGYMDDEAWRMVDLTNGIYSALRKRIFRNAERGTHLPWVQTPSKPVMAALLCGQWKGSEGDRSFFEKLTGMSYEECMEELQKYTHFEEPLIIEGQLRRGTYKQLTSAEDAWAELGGHVTDSLWKEYVEQLRKAISEYEPTEREKFELQINGGQEKEARYETGWSHICKEGLIQTLTLWGIFKPAHDQVCIDQIVHSILSEIKSSKEWRNTASYLPGFCEASPKSVMKRLEDELKQPTGMKEIFPDGTENEIWGESQYISILWAVEELIQNKVYARRAADWLWQINEWDIPYKLSNKPDEILSITLCPWLGITALDENEKRNEAGKAIQKYPKAWELIAGELPADSMSKMTTLHTPKYRSIEREREIDIDQQVETYYHYLELCVKATQKKPERWQKILEHLHYFDEEKQRKVLQQLVSECKEMPDYDQAQIKLNLRKIVSRHRLAPDATWAMSEENTLIYEEFLSQIQCENPIYEYLYLFMPKYAFPLLHPETINRHSDHELLDERDVLIDAEIKKGIEQFKQKQVSVDEAIDIILNHNIENRIGVVLAHYYSEGRFDDAIYTKLLQKDKQGQQVYDYVKSLDPENPITLPEIVQRAEEEGAANSTVARLISLQSIRDISESLLFQTRKEIKEVFFKNGNLISIEENATQDVYLYALNECVHYGNLQSYVYYLYIFRIHLTKEQIYQAFLKILSFTTSENKLDQMSIFYLKSILKILQDEFVQEIEKCVELARIERYLVNILDYSDMKCLDAILRRDPRPYAELVDKLYLHEGENARDEPIDSRYSWKFRTMRFCPAEKDGDVEFEALKQWVDGLKELLDKQHQGNLWSLFVGKLLNHSPIGEDGFPPCEAVRQFLEEFCDDEMREAYMNEETNKRGGFIGSSGKAERALAEDYRTIAEKLKKQYPRTADIYDGISARYMRWAEEERKLAEDDR